MDIKVPLPALVEDESSDEHQSEEDLSPVHLSIDPVSPLAATDALIRVCKGESLPDSVQLPASEPGPDDDTPAVVRTVERLIQLGASVSCKDEKVWKFSLETFVAFCVYAGKRACISAPGLVTTYLGMFQWTVRCR
jgi:hypothetical protein